MADLPARKDHSLFHATAQAHCQTDWTKMQGSERIRTCSYCHSIVFKLDDLSEEESRQLILSTGRTSDEPLHLSRRADGTFVCEDLPCSPLSVILTGPASALRAVAQLICADRRLAISFLAVMITSLGFMLPGALWALLRGGVILLMCALWCFLHAALTLAYSSKMDGRRWQHDNLKKLFGSSFVNFLCYVATVMAVLVCGTLGEAIVFVPFSVFQVPPVVCVVLLLIPPAIVASRACLGLPIMCLEDEGGLAAHRDSFELTKGATTLILSQLAMPAAFWMILWLIFSNSSFNLGSLASSLYVFLTLIVTCTCVPIQVNLYRQLKARQALRKSGLLKLLSSRLPEIGKS
ncbi:MAG TPA: hypothetical protein V6D22_05335 [Candidatus Obscuribacterales bacterium]